MVLVLVGASGSGKSTIEKKLFSAFGFDKVISCTTRNPREGEVPDKDYYFCTNEKFKQLIKNESLAEYEEYSKGRFYGSFKSDYLGIEDKVAVLTPGGLRQLKQNLPNLKFFSVLIEADLGTRMKRYIDRIGTENFTFSDKDELCARVERDYGMFLGVENEVDLVMKNNENANIRTLCEEIVTAFDEKKMTLESERTAYSR